MRKCRPDFPDISHFFHSERPASRGILNNRRRFGRYVDNKTPIWFVASVVENVGERQMHYAPLVSRSARFVADSSF